jgi:hypothetical protein
MNKEILLKEKENLEYKLSLINKALNNSEQGRIQPEEFQIRFDPWRDDIIWQIANIIRTSPIVNKNYPWGYDCDICRECGNNCSCDGDGIDCNFAFMEYFERELRDRGYYEGKG